jgi:hypothetical protein
MLPGDGHQPPSVAVRERYSQEVAQFGEVRSQCRQEVPWVRRDDVVGGDGAAVVEGAADLDQAVVQLVDSLGVFERVVAWSSSGSCSPTSTGLAPAPDAAGS